MCHNVVAGYAIVLRCRCCLDVWGTLAPARVVQLTTMQLATQRGLVPLNPLPFLCPRPFEYLSRIIFGVHCSTLMMTFWWWQVRTDCSRCTVGKWEGRSRSVHAVQSHLEERLLDQAHFLCRQLLNPTSGPFQAGLICVYLYIYVIHFVGFWCEKGPKDCHFTIIPRTPAKPNKNIMHGHACIISQNISPILLAACPVVQRWLVLLGGFPFW